MKQKMLRYKPKLDDRWRYNRVYFSISNDRTFSEKKTYSDVWRSGQVLWIVCSNETASKLLQTSDGEKHHCTDTVQYEMWEMYTGGGWTVRFGVSRWCADMSTRRCWDDDMCRVVRYQSSFNPYHVPTVEPQVVDDVVKILYTRH